MAIESVIFALGLWGLSRELSPLLESFGVNLNTTPQADPAMAQKWAALAANVFDRLKAEGRPIPGLL